MFFDDTVAAFASIRAQLRPDGRLAFVCWQALADNPWYTGPSLLELLESVPAAEAGASAAQELQVLDLSIPSRPLVLGGWRI